MEGHNEIQEIIYKYTPTRKTNVKWARSNREKAEVFNTHVTNVFQIKPEIPMKK